MANILVIRLSAIGDVAMTVPVIYSAAKANPTDSFTVLTQAFLIPVFINRPKNVNVIGINTKSTEKTLAGLLRFASALVKYDFDMVLDLHDVLRTMIIRTLFRLNGRRVFVVDKARKDRARLTDAKHKRFKQLRPVIERYADVFRNAGLHYTESFTSLYETSTPDLSALEPLAGTKTGKWIGIAPFAKHRGKIYPTGEMELVMAELSDREDFTIFLFGGRGYEEALLDQWAFEYPRVKSVAGKYSLDQELALISRLDLLICMDSANMHFASLVGTRVLSLGMVGALSIVRFRTAIKEPLDIAFLFWSIAVGIVLAAGLIPLALVGSLFIGLVLILFVNRKSHLNPFIVVLSVKDKQSEKAAREFLEKTCKKCVIKSKTATKGAIELNVEVRLKMDDTDFINALSETEGVQSAALVSYNGDYMG